MSFKFANVTDTHLYGPPKSGPCPEPVKDEVFLLFHDETAKHDIDFIVNTGDLLTAGAGGDLSRYEHFMSLMKQARGRTGVPIHLTRGNHDGMIIDDTDYENICGTSTYWFAHKGWAMVILDHYWGMYEVQPNYYSLSPWGFDRLAQLLEEIPRDMPMIVMMHQNPTGTTRFSRGELLYERLQGWNVKLLIFGHVQNNYLSTYAGIPHMTVVGEHAAFDSAPLTYAIVTCHEDGLIETDWYPHTIHIDPSLLPKPTALKNSTAASPTTDWRDHLGPRGSRASADALPDKPPLLAWQAELPGAVSVGPPTVQNNILVVGTKSRGRREQCAVSAFDAASGKLLWQQPVDASVEAGALLAGDNAYAATTAGTVYALDLASGDIHWQWNNGENLPFASMPALDEGLLHIGANWECYAIDSESGRCVWRQLAAEQGVSYFCPGHATPVIIGDRVYHSRPYNGSPQSLLQSFDKKTGRARILGAHDYANFPGQRQASPLIWDGKILAISNGLLAFDPTDLDHALFAARGHNGAATPAVRNDIAYVSYHREICAHDLKNNGAVLWRASHEGARYQFSGGVDWPDVYRDKRLPAGNYSAPLVNDDKLLTADSGGHLRCLRTADGTEQWRLTLKDAMICAPTLSGNTIFVGDLGGTLYALTS